MQPMYSSLPGLWTTDAAVLALAGIDPITKSSTGLRLGLKTAERGSASPEARL